MKPYQRLLCLGCLCGFLLGGILCFAAATAAPVGDPTPSTAPVPTRMDNDANTRKGFDHFYSLEYDKSIHEFELAQQAHPEDPFAVNHTLAAVIFKELYRIGALDTEAYAADNFLTKKPAEPLDPTLHDRVMQLVNLSLSLSQAQLDKNPNRLRGSVANNCARYRAAAAASHPESAGLFAPSFPRAADV